MDGSVGMEVALKRLIKKPFRYFANRLFRRQSPLSSGTTKKYQQWSIGIYSGESPLTLHPDENVDNPVLTRANISDVEATFIADPFMISVENGWYMFFEVMNQRTGKGEIGYATSDGALKWTYHQIVLREPFHLSYPYIFEWQNAYYMIPESYEAKSVRLYKAMDFPRRWSLVETLLEGDDFVDPSIFYFNHRWWLLVDLARPPYYAGILRLFHGDNLEGPWVEHPRSPIIEDNPHIARPAGRVIVSTGSVIRYAQDCCPVYGSRVRAFEIDELTPTSYHEQTFDFSPIVEASGTGWNESGMHHLDPHLVGQGRWIACVDGFRWQVWPERQQRTEDAE